MLSNTITFWYSGKKSFYPKSSIKLKDQKPPSMEYKNTFALLLASSSGIPSGHLIKST